MTDYEETYERLWKDIAEPGGVLDMDAVKRELHDYATALNEVSKAYCHVTSGKFSKLNTDHGHIIDCYEDAIQKSYEEGHKDCAGADGEVSRLTIEGEDEGMQQSNVNYVGLFCAVLIAFLTSLATLSASGAKPLQMICGAAVSALSALGAGWAKLRT